MKTFQMLVLILLAFIAAMLAIAVFELADIRDGIRLLHVVR